MVRSGKMDDEVKEVYLKDLRRWLLSRYQMDKGQITDFEFSELSEQAVEDFQTILRTGRHKPEGSGHDEWIAAAILAAKTDTLGHGVCLVKVWYGTDVPFSGMGGGGSVSWKRGDIKDMESSDG
jgi:hypothetical protein